MRRPQLRAVGAVILVAALAAGCKSIEYKNENGPRGPEHVSIGGFDASTLPALSLPANPWPWPLSGGCSTGRCP